MIYIIDFDGTVVKSDYVYEKRSMFLTLDYIKPIGSRPSVFERLTKSGHEYFVLTTRHPSLQKQIAKYLNIPATRVICRPFYLSRWSMWRITHSNRAEKKFLSKMVEWKTQMLLGYRDLHDEVVFIDDCIYDYIKRDELDKKGIYLIHPDRFFVEGYE